MNFIQQNTGYILFQNIITGNLKVVADGQINVIAGNRFRPAAYLNYLSHIVYKNLFRSLNPLKVLFHISFNPGLPHNIV